MGIEVDRCDRWLQVTTLRLAREPVEQGRGHAPSYPHPRSTQSQRHQVARPDQHNMALVREKYAALFGMWRSMVCGALWWSPDRTRPLRGQIANFIFLWQPGTGGTAVSLAS